MTAYRVWHSMLYNCTHMTTVGVKWLIFIFSAEVDDFCRICYENSFSGLNRWFTSVQQVASDSENSSVLRNTSSK